MDKPHRIRSYQLTVDDRYFAQALARRVAEMRMFLNAMEPASPSLALKTLREAFPDTPLDERVRAVMGSRH